jgi:hypothetical protein
MTQQTTGSKSSFTPMGRPMLQRKCACGGTPGASGECAACKKKREASQGMLQRAASNANQVNEVPAIVHDVLRSSGQPLETGTREFMESRFGQDFSGVRVHTDSRAAESARAVNALAYTVGRDVVFDSGRYAPKTQAGQKLMAHELTHVVQQNARAQSVQTKLSIGDIDDSSEREANRVAESILDRQAIDFRMQRAISSGSVIQRIPCPDIPVAHRLIMRGSANPAVGDAQRKLNKFHEIEVAAGRPGLPGYPLNPDCVFGEKTLAAVLEFQQRVFPDPAEHDGKIGTRTWEKLDAGNPLVLPPTPSVSPTPPPTPGPTCVPRTGYTVHGCYCGKDSSCTSGRLNCPPMDALDACCQAHDLCYTASGVEVYDSFNPLSSGFAAARACDIDLCNCARALPLTDRSATYRSRIETFFQCP